MQGVACAVADHLAKHDGIRSKGSDDLLTLPFVAIHGGEARYAAVEQSLVGRDLSDGRRSYVCHVDLPAETEKPFDCHLSVVLWLVCWN